jgi:hypothetical protein
LSDPNLLPESFIDCQDPSTTGQVEEGSSAYYAKDYAKAMSDLTPAAQDPVAQCFLGLVYLDGPEQEAMRESGWEGETKRLSRGRV